MSLRGYKPKTKPAPWTTVPGWHPSPPETWDRGTYGTVRGNPPGMLLPHQRKRLRRVSKSRARELAAYRREASEFVRAARARGLSCPVVAAVPELREGFKYGHRISAKLNEVHHLRGRAGRLLRDKRYWVAVSKQGHRWIHQQPKAAQAKGWLAGPGEWGRAD